MSNFKFFVKKHRKNKGFTLQQLATLSGSSKSYIWEIENNPKANPSMIKMFEISKILGVSIYDLFDPPSPEGKE